VCSHATPAEFLFNGARLSIKQSLLGLLLTIVTIKTVCNFRNSRYIIIYTQAMLPVPVLKKTT